MQASDPTLDLGTPPAVPPPRPWPAVAGYAIVRELGRGGMGVVYQALDQRLNRTVALKMVLAGAFAGPRELARFRAEAEAIAQLQHPNIVQVYETGEVATAEGVSAPYFALEYVGGGTLHAKLADQPQPPHAAAELVEQLALAVEHAHAHGILHRDLKPANVLLGSTDDEPAVRGTDTTRPLTAPYTAVTAAQLYGQPKITDFGLAKRLDGTGPSVSHTLVGTPAYMAPEQAEMSGGPRAPLGPAVDVYALGVILYEMLAGRPPFLGHDPLDTLLQLRMLDPPPPSQWGPRVPADLQTVCLKCLEKSPTKRYPSARALADDLRRFLNDEPIVARPAGAVEKAVKWARRRPGIAGLIGAVALTTLLGLAATAWQASMAFAERDAAREARAAAELDRDAAVAAKADAAAKERRARHSLYLARVAQAYSACQVGDHARARQVLFQCDEEFRRWEWHYLAQLSASELANVHGPGNNAWVRGIAVNPANATVAVAGGGNPYNDDGQHTEPGETAIYALKGGTAVFLHGHADVVTCVSYHPTDGRVATGSDDRTVRIATPGKPDADVVMRDHPGKIEGVAFSPDGTRLATVGNGGLFVYDTATGKRQLKCAEAEGDIHGVAWSPDGTQVALAIDLFVKLYDAGSGEFLSQCAGHLRAVRAVAWSRDGQRLASAGDDGSVRVWDAATCRESRVPGQHQGWVWCVAFSPDGGRVASGGSDGAIGLWPTDGGPETMLRGHARAVRAVAYTPDGGMLFSGGQDGSLRLWDVRTDPQNRLIPGSETQPTAAIQWHPAEGRLGVFRNGGGGVEYWLPGGRQPVTRRQMRATPPPRVRNELHLTADGNAAVGRTGSDWRSFAIWDLPGQTIRTLEQQPHALAATGVSRDSRVAAALTWNRPAFPGPTAPPPENRLTFWDVPSGRLVRSQPFHCLYPECIAFDTAAERVAVAGGYRGQIRGTDYFRADLHVLEVATGRPVATFDASRCPINFRTVAFHPNGRLLATSADLDTTVYLWDATVGGPPTRTLHASGKLGAVTFSPDGTRVAATGYDSAVYLWDVDSGEPVLVLTPAITQRPSDTAYPLKLLFTPDGTKIISTNWNGTINVFDAVVPKRATIVYFNRPK